jgi:NhaP-type Na+/H+ or K+/H+ antiporter
MHDVTEQVERLAMMVLLLLFGGALARGLLDGLTWEDVAAAMVIRPVTGLIGLAGFQAAWSEKLTIAFFSIRGVGSFYYLAYGLNHMEVEGAERLCAIVGLVVVLSIFMHGLTVTPIMRLLDRKHGRDPDADDMPPPGLQGPGEKE